MVLGNTTFTQDPISMTILTPDVSIAWERTYSNVAVFNWGSTIVGKEVALDWNAMPIGQYEGIRTSYEAATTVKFYPSTSGTVSTDAYNVRILDFHGQYLLGYGITTLATAAPFRGESKLILLIESTTT